ncbi:MAG: UDP-N-acetylglucosamine--N-acetylmuramyl-(pentapeptide) pyrophosphoryl-undecaprenol N-acetylglucosamine transferase [Candidatus Falkowbacteria bacterium]
MYNKKTKILLTGGGTGGSVAPLLAITDKLGQKKYKYLWIGTRKGPEREMIKAESIHPVKFSETDVLPAKQFNRIKFKSIVSTKFRRYFSLRTFLAPLWIIVGFIQSLFIILAFRPRWIISAGGFVSVPVVWAGWLLGRKILIHQQDAQSGLANKLMAPFAKVITVAFEKSLRDYGKKAKWIGNPTRVGTGQFTPPNGLGCPVLTKQKQKSFNLKSDLPVVLILGGGTGSMFINKLVADSLEDLIKFCQIIHVTGKGKQPDNIPVSIANYYQYDFLNFNQMAEAYQQADVVVSRCGMSTLAELSYLGKPSILIYLPGHQEYNARIFEEYSAAIVLDQPVLEKTFFINHLKNLLDDEKLQKLLSKNIKKVLKTGASQELAKIIKT